jgi:uncharacterized membrane protein YhaH (DUF805 family)
MPVDDQRAMPMPDPDDGNDLNPLTEPENGSVDSAPAASFQEPYPAAPQQVQDPSVTSYGSSTEDETVEDGGVAPSMTFDEARKSLLKHLFTFKGRASRSEYWWGYLLTVIMGTALGALTDLAKSMLDSSSMIFSVVSIVIFIADILVLIICLALLTRRAHDSNKSEWWVTLPMLLSFLAGFVGVVAGVIGTVGGLRLTALIGFAAVIVSAIVIVIFWLVVALAKPDPAGARFDRKR